LRGAAEGLAILIAGDSDLRANRFRLGSKQWEETMGSSTSDYLEKPALLEPTKRSNQVALQTIDIYFLTFKESGVIEASEMI
jgi:hypothetical protein